MLRQGSRVSRQGSRVPGLECVVCWYFGVWGFGVWEWIEEFRFQGFWVRFEYRMK